MSDRPNDVDDHDPAARPAAGSDDYTVPILPGDEGTGGSERDEQRTAHGRGGDAPPPRVIRRDDREGGGGPAAGTPDQPRVTVDRDRSWTWPLINLIGLLVVLAVNALANIIPFNGLSTADVINQDPVPFQPAGWVFTIWGFIYLLLAVFVVYGLLPMGRHSPRLQRISPFFLIANIANATWIFLWHWEQFAASLVTILVLLGSLVVIYLGVRVHRRSTSGPSRWTRLVLWTPFSVYVGWICVASLANLMVWLDRSNWDGGPFTYNIWAGIFMAGGTLIAALFALVGRDPLVPLVFVWAYIGIAAQWGGDRLSVTIAAVVFAVITAGLAFMGTLLEFDRNALRAIRPRHQSPPPMEPVDP